MASVVVNFRVPVRHSYPLRAESCVPCSSESVRILASNAAKNVSFSPLLIAEMSGFPTVTTVMLSSFNRHYLLFVFLRYILQCRKPFCDFEKFSGEILL